MQRLLPALLLSLAVVGTRALPLSEQQNSAPQSEQESRPGMKASDDQTPRVLSSAPVAQHSVAKAVGDGLLVGWKGLFLLPTVHRARIGYI
jgi:hypothetical protein